VTFALEPTAEAITTLDPGAGLAEDLRGIVQGILKAA